MWSTTRSLLTTSSQTGGREPANQPGGRDKSGATRGRLHGDDMIPPPYLSITFDASHSHYLVSEADDIDWGDLTEAIANVWRHGYGMDAGSQLIVFHEPGRGRRGVERVQSQGTAL